MMSWKGRNRNWGREGFWTDPGFRMVSSRWISCEISPQAFLAIWTPTSQREQIWIQSICYMLNAFTPMRDQEGISPYNINSIKQTNDDNKDKNQLGENKWIQYQILLETKRELYGRQLGESLMRTWEWHGCVCNKYTLRIRRACLFQDLSTDSKIFMLARLVLVIIFKTYPTHKLQPVRYKSAD